MISHASDAYPSKGCGSNRCPIFNGTDGRIALLFLAYVACHTALGTPSTASRQHRRKWDIGCFRTPKLAVGMTLSDIATALALSLRTVSQSSVAIKSKLGINRPIEFTIYALKHRFIDIQDL